MIYIKVQEWLKDLARVLKYWQMTKMTKNDKTDIKWKKIIKMTKNDSNSKILKEVIKILIIITKSNKNYFKLFNNK